METPELLMNSNIVPIYITSRNVVTPVITIDSFYKNILLLLYTAANILRIVIQTTTFILKEIFAEVFTKMTLVKTIYIIGIYHLFILAVLDNHQRKIIQQKEQIEILEKNLKHLKKANKVRDDFEQLWIHDIKSYNQETTKKMINIEKKVKKLEKDLI
jgi:Ca2+/H+ antiporter